MIMQKYIHLLLSLPKSVYINFKVFPFRMAVRLPLLVDYRTVLCGLYKGCFVLDFPTCKKLGCVKLGWGNGSFGNNCNIKNYIVINGQGQFIFKSGEAVRKLN